MKRARTLLFCLPVFPLLFSLSCATTRLTSTWSDVSFRGAQIRSIVVVAIPDKDISRRLVEIAFASRLEKYGIKAVPSHIVIFSDRIDKEMIAAKAKEQGFDGVLAMRVVDQKTVERYYPGYPGGKSYFALPWDYHAWGDKYYQGFPANTAPTPTPYMSFYKILSIETDLYDIGSGRVIWSSLSDTFVKEMFEREIESFAGIIVAALQKANLLPSEK